MYVCPFVRSFVRSSNKKRGEGPDEEGTDEEWTENEIEEWTRHANFFATMRECGTTLNR